MFMLKISKKTNFNIFLNITFITVLILNLYNILYSLVVIIFYVIYLFFIKNQNIILVLFIIFAKQIV